MMIMLVPKLEVEPVREMSPEGDRDEEGSVGMSAWASSRGDLPSDRVDAKMV